MTDRKRLKQIISTASKIIGCNLPSLDILYRDRVLKKSASIVNDQHHPAHNLFQLMRSGERYRSIKSGSNRSLNSFYPTAVRMLNECKQSTGRVHKTRLS